MAQNGSENKKHGIQARQRATIPILASSASIAEAARLSNISRRTLTRWLQDEDFRSQVAEFQQQAAELARVRLDGLALQAISVLEDTLHDPNPALRFRAARDTIRFSTEINLARKLRDQVQDMEETISVWKGNDES